MLKGSVCELALGRCNRQNDLALRVFRSHDLKGNESNKCRHDHEDDLLGPAFRQSAFAKHIDKQAAKQNECPDEDGNASARHDCGDISYLLPFKNRIHDVGEGPTNRADPKA